MDAANAVEQDGRVISKVQAAAEQKIANFDPKNTWVDISLGRTPAQQLWYEQSVAAQTMSGGQFHYNKESLVNPVSHCNRDTVFTTTRDVSLGPITYKAVDNNDLASSKADKAFFTTGFVDNKEDKGGRKYAPADGCCPPGQAPCPRSAPGHRLNNGQSSELQGR
jgi:hypothetical protein